MLIAVAMAETVYSKEQIEQWYTNLEEIALKPRTIFTKKQAVEALIVPIEKALKTRSYAEVAKGLEAWGLEISEGSLRQQVSRYRRAHKTETIPNKKSASRQSRKSKAKPSSSETQTNRSTSQTDDTSVTEPTAHKTKEFSASKTENSTPKRSGRGRLKSDDSSHRYPGDQGKPLEMNTNYD